MTACFVGETNADVLERVARFVSIRGDDADPATLVAERKDRWLVGTLDEVAARIAELARARRDRVSSSST